jgi:hypothetical protein
MRQRCRNGRRVSSCHVVTIGPRGLPSRERDVKKDEKVCGCGAHV